MKLAYLLSSLAILAVFGMSAPAHADDDGAGLDIKPHGQAKKIIRRNRVEVLQLRGERRNPNFLEDSFHKTQVADAKRWSQQHDHLTPVKGLKPRPDRMPASITKADTGI